MSCLTRPHESKYAEGSCAKTCEFFFGICYLSLCKRVEFIQVLPSLAIAISITNRLNLPTLLPALLLLEQTYGTKEEFGNTYLH